LTGGNTPQTRMDTGFAALRLLSTLAEVPDEESPPASAGTASICRTVADRRKPSTRTEGASDEGVQAQRIADA